MKKAITILIGIMCILMIVIGGISYHYYTTTINVEKLSQHLLEQPIYNDMKEIYLEEIDLHYKEIDRNDVVDAKTFVATDGTSREFAIFTAPNLESADNIITALQWYCKERLNYYEEVNPTPLEVKRIKRFFIFSTRNYVIFTISDEVRTGHTLVYNFLEERHYKE